MNLDRLYNIACVLSAIFICLPFLMDSLIADIPRWGWQIMTVFIAVSFLSMAVLWLLRKNRDWDKEHGRTIHKRRKR